MGKPRFDRTFEIKGVTPSSRGVDIDSAAMQLYVGYPGSSVDRPVRELKGFARVPLRPGETRTVALALPASELRYWDPARHGWVLEPGRVQLEVGASSADIRLRQTIDVRP